jgi:hypothetical protein
VIAGATANITPQITSGAESSQDIPEITDHLITHDTHKPRWDGCRILPNVKCPSKHRVLLESGLHTQNILEAGARKTQPGPPSTRTHTPL